MSASTPLALVSTAQPPPSRAAGSKPLCKRDGLAARGGKDLGALGLQQRAEAAPGSSAVPVSPTRTPREGQAWLVRRSAAAWPDDDDGRGLHAAPSAARAAMSPSVPRTAAGRRVLPPESTAAGVSGAAPEAP